MKRALVVLVALVAIARADDGGKALRDALGSIDALEAVGAQRPVTQWTDDAWIEAARLAERAGDRARARRDYEQALAVATDERTRSNLAKDLQRIAAVAGTSSEWNAVAAEHDRLASRVLAPGDPRAALDDLARLLEQNPRYPRRAIAMITLAHGWEREGEPDRAVTWLERARDAAQDDAITRRRSIADLARVLTAHDRLADARSAIDSLDDRAVAADLSRDLAAAERRQKIRWALVAIVAALLVAGVIALRRYAGSWRGVARRLWSPPAEVFYIVPIAGVLVLVAQTGNPLVARAVVTIAIAGVVIAWLSGAILDARRERITLLRALVHATCAAVAIASAAYLAIDRGRMLDMVAETWREGPANR